MSLINLALDCRLFSLNPYLYCVCKFRWLTILRSKIFSFLIKFLERISKWKIVVKWKVEKSFSLSDHANKLELRKENSMRRTVKTNQNPKIVCFASKCKLLCLFFFFFFLLVFETVKVTTVVCVKFFCFSLMWEQVFCFNENQKDFLCGKKSCLLTWASYLIGQTFLRPNQNYTFRIFRWFSSHVPKKIKYSLHESEGFTCVLQFSPRNSLPYKIFLFLDKIHHFCQDVDPPPPPPLVLTEFGPIARRPRAFEILIFAVGVL